MRVLYRSLLVWMILLCQAGLCLASRDPGRYPLKVHVFNRKVHVHHWHRTREYSGTGHANLLDGNTISGVEFSYECGDKFLDSEADEYYPARWKKPGQKLEILMGVIGSEDKTRVCDLNTDLKEYVFAKVKGKVVTLSPAEYANLQEAKDERAHSLEPDDLDPTHYPVEISLMHLAWTGEVNGVHTGAGQGNIRDAAGLHAVDFSLHCPVIVQTTPEGRYLLARWMEPQKSLLLLLRSIDVDGAPGATCQVLTAIEPDVYVRTSGGNVKAVSQAEYQRGAGTR